MRIFFQLIFNNLNVDFCENVPKAIFHNLQKKSIFGLREVFVFYIILLLAIVAGTIFFAFVGCMIDNMFELIIQKMDAKN